MMEPSLLLHWLDFRRLSLIESIYKYFDVVFVLIWTAEILLQWSESELPNSSFFLHLFDWYMNIFSK